MARGRKKGGLNINSIDDRNELTNMIINQINSLNKKIKAFNKAGITEHSELVQGYITEDMGQFTKNGTLSKSKKFYGSKNKVWLKKTLATLVKLNNHEIYGTVNKYNKEMTVQMKGVRAYVESYFRNKGYDDKFILEIVNSKDFYVNLFQAFGENPGRYGSDQVIEKIALDYEGNGLSEKEKNRILQNIEYSNNVKRRIQEEQRAFEEFKQARNSRKR